MILRTFLQFLLTTILILTITGCNFLSVNPGKEKLPSVAVLPLPNLPDWIEQISPVGDAKNLNQILIIFQEPLIPIEKLDSLEQQNLLTKFTLWPPLPGKFRFLTPRMVGFQTDQALPKATRFKVTLQAGLNDLKNHRLNKDLAWTFSTEPIEINNLPGVNPIEKAELQPVDLQPQLQFTSNQELDIESLQRHLQLIPEGKKQGINFRVELAKSEQKENLDPLEKFDPSAKNWVYNITPDQQLDKATTYNLKFSPGILPTYGNLASTKEFNSKLATYSPLAFQGIRFYGQPDTGGTYGRFIKGSPQLEFNNIILPDSAKENITINPQPKNIDKLLQIYENDKIVIINPYALEPATTYTINIGRNLKDQFGQTLGKPISIKYETGNLAADIWAPSDFYIFPTGKDLQLNINTLNLPERKYQAAFTSVKPLDLVYARTANDLLSQPEKWQSFKVSGKQNQDVNLAVPIRDKLTAKTGMLAYGIKAKTNKYQENGKQVWQEPTNYGIVQLTNLGVFSQWFPEMGLIRVHHLNDGSPVSNAKIEIYQSKLSAKSRPAPLACSTGKTDKNGILKLDKQDLQSCYTKEKNNNIISPELLVIARENQDWAFARTEEYSGVFGYGIDAGWPNNAAVSRGVIFSDRQLYQPGEKAWLTGFAGYLKQGKIQPDQNANYQLTLISPDGKQTDLGKKSTNEFGTISLELTLDQNRGLGYYTITAKGENGREISGEFRVAEFKPPNFKVAVDVNKEFAFIGDRVEAKVDSNYLFGSPVAGGEVKYFVTRQTINFIPQGWEEFSFGRQWFWPEESPSVPNDVLQTNNKLDANGKSQQTVNIAKDLPYPMTYRVDVQVADVSNLSVANSQTFTALPSNRLIGLKSNFVAKANQDFPVEFIVTNPQGKLLENQPITIELQQMKYSSVTQVVEGSNTAKNQVEYKTVSQTELNSGNSPQVFNFKAYESGTYRIRAKFRDNFDEVNASDLQIWVTGENAVYWGEEDKNRLEIKLNKQEFKLGEIATALIQSPYAEGEVYFAVIKDKPLYEKTVKIKGGAPQIQFTVTPEMLPNAAVEAVLVRQGKPLNQVETENLENLMRVGFAPFKVNLAEKYLQVQVKPTQTNLAPGEEETVELILTDNQGKPTVGQFTVMVVNEAVLQLSGYRPPNLVDTVYAEQPIYTRFSDNRPDVKLAQATMAKPKGWGYDGGLSSGLANTRIRTNFQALAYYNGAVLTDSQGKVTVKFKLPDDLTTWRIMVVAADKNLRFGNGEATLITTKPLLTNAILPQFARSGDRIFAGVSITNTTGNTGNLNITGKLTGSLQFAENKSGCNQNQCNISVQTETTTQAYRFPVTVGNIANSKIQFTTQLNQTADAFEVPLEIKPLEITEQVVETGVTEKEIKIPLNIDQNIVSDAGGLNIQLASSLIPEITAPAKQVLTDNDLPFAETAASELLIAASLQTLTTKYNQTFTEFNPQQQATQAINQLQKLQLSDNGFAAFPNQPKSDPWVSVYATEALVKANQVFPNLVKPEMLNRLKSYLQTVLANPGQYEFCNQKQCKSQLQLNALNALAQLGDKRNSFLGDIYQQKDKFDLVTQIKLARYLTQFPEWEDEAQLIRSDLQKNIYQTGRSAVINIPSRWDWLNSNTTIQAQALRLFITQPSKPELLDKLFQSLLSLRRNGTWLNTYDNAQALTALVEYSQLQPTPPNFYTSVKLAGKKLGENRFQGYQNPNLHLNLAIDKLPKGKHDLVLQKNGKGKLHYLISYNYRLNGIQSGRFNGLRITREISKVNEDKILNKTGMYAVDKPLTLKPGEVFDIGLEIITDHPVDHVIIKDPLPAGFEAIDKSFQTATAALQAKADNWELGYRTIYKDKIVAYADHLEPGVYNLHYLVRSVTPGTFLWPGSQVYLQYAPEEFGRSADVKLVLED
ncbi:MAG TPA: alpha-2-macroglobulin [Nostocaceae cyanobacterium]|nr:alpha-2-macroglobulin [Nostocaceae cyanobacterium]